MVRYTRKSKAMVGGKRGFKMLVGSRARGGHERNRIQNRLW